MFVLACGSLGLIGLSRFLLCSVSFFAPKPFFSGLCRVRSGRTFRRSHRKKLSNPSKRSHSLTPFRCSAFRSFIPALAFPAKKLHYTAKNRASPAVNRRQPQPSLNRCGLSVSATLAPLAVGSRLNAATKKCTAIPLHYISLHF